MSIGSLDTGHQPFTHNAQPEQNIQQSDVLTTNNINHSAQEHAGHIGSSRGDKLRWSVCFQGHGYVIVNSKDHHQKSIDCKFVQNLIDEIDGTSGISWSELSSHMCHFVIYIQ